MNGKRGERLTSSGSDMSLAQLGHKCSLDLLLRVARCWISPLRWMCGGRGDSIVHSDRSDGGVPFQERAL